MKHKTPFRILVTLIGLLAASQARAENIALVWGGDGTENWDATGTLYSAVRAAEAAGFKSVIITDRVDESLLKRASLWIQPGGPNFTQAYHMQRTGVFAQVKQFVASGGGYVGFCGGGYMGQSTGSLGLGLLPGNAWRQGEVTHKTEVTWHGRKRYVHYEHGPAFQDTKGVEVFATYNLNGAPAAIRGNYGLGKVLLSGPHPEALDDWLPVEDPDGLDTDLAVDMIRSAAR